jgi:hypothetical protein
VADSQTVLARALAMRCCHWRASFYVTGLAHSILGGSAWQPTLGEAFPVNEEDTHASAGELQQASCRRGGLALIMICSPMS